MSLPPEVTDTRLWRRIVDRTDLVATIQELRRTATAFADTVARDLPGFTDHSIRHFDALWGIADIILTISESEALTGAEAFVLGTTFYLHDIGMAMAGTPEGRSRIELSSEYSRALARFSLPDAKCPSPKDAALAEAVRKQHAHLCVELATRPIPGTSKFLIELPSVRDLFGHTAGLVAASHHWSLEKLDDEFGRTGIVPIASSTIDRAYVACLLRVIDYAHINQQRAEPIDRLFRRKMSEESVTHWRAQEHIQGPYRAATELTYSTASPVTDIDSWWLFYEMLHGLDQEVRLVERYLAARTASKGRFSLAGVRGAGSPEECAQYIKTDGFEPIDIKVTAGSIERLVRLLGSETLYGRHPYVPIRELIQNANDAVTLRHVESQDVPSIPILLTVTAGPQPTLEIVDKGVGMTRAVVTDHLLAIASDYWGSARFQVDFPVSAKEGFRHAGRFGVGFLSTFMLGDVVEIQTERRGHGRLGVQIRGLSQRGQLRITDPTGHIGTSVKIALKEPPDDLATIARTVRTLCPMIENTIRIEHSDAQQSIAAGWWRTLPVAEFLDVLDENEHVLTPNDTPKHVRNLELQISAFDTILDGTRTRTDVVPERWREDPPETIDSEGHYRFIADPLRSTVFLCSHGFLIKTIDVPGFTGIFDSDKFEPDVKRADIQNLDSDEIWDIARRGVEDGVVEILDGLASARFSARWIRFVSICVSRYGYSVGRRTNLQWIPIVNRSGDLSHLNAAEFVERVKGASVVRLSYGLHPSSALEEWSNVDESDLCLVLDHRNDPQVRRPHRERDETVQGRLKEYWKDFRTATSLTAVLVLIAEGWDQKYSRIANVGSWTFEQSWVLGDIRRTEVGQSTT